MKNNIPAQYFPIPELREQLRLQAVEKTGRLSRSVARLTSCDALPCLEYGEEVKQEFSLAEATLYLQHCRSTLEQCIGRNAAALRYRWSDGSTSVTRFKKVGPNRVRVTGLKTL